MLLHVLLIAVVFSTSGYVGISHVVMLEIVYFIMRFMHNRRFVHS